MKTLQLTEQEFQNYQNFINLSKNQNFSKLIDILSDKSVLNKILFLADILKKNENTVDFEQWNDQFLNRNIVNEQIPEYKTTLNKFRKYIYDSENKTEGDLNFEELKQSIKEW